MGRSAMETASIGRLLTERWPHRRRSQLATGSEPAALYPEVYAKSRAEARGRYGGIE